MSENGEIYTAGKNFTLPSAVTALTNSTSASSRMTKGGLYQDGGAWGRTEEKGFLKKSFNFNIFLWSLPVRLGLAARRWFVPVFG